ncbi:MAG: T9SS type A sorting domain-containing protein [Saprospiraceae bacterium]
MKQLNTIKSLLFTLLLLSSSTAFAQVFWTETFSNQATATTNWVYSGTNPGAEKWFWTSDPGAGYQTPTSTIPAFGAPTASTGYFLFNSDANGNGNSHDAKLTGTGVPVNCTGQTGVKLSFYAQYARSSQIAKAQVGVSTDGTTFVYKDIFVGLPVDNLFQGNVDVTLPEADNKPQVWIQFRWIGNWEYHFKVDDLSLTGTPAEVPCALNPSAIICDNFESYTVGALSPQALFWKPWAGLETGVLSALVSTDRASEGTKSMKVQYAVAGADQGADQLLLLGNKTSGRYELKWKMYVPSGKAAYYNIQNSETPGQQWNLDMFFDSNGVARVIINPTVANQPANTTFSFPKDTWFTVTHYFDLDNNLSKLFINDNIVIGWSYTGNLGGIDYYSLNTWDQYYVDEVSYVSLPAQIFNPDICGSAVDLTQYFGQTPNLPQITGLYDNSNATVSSTDPTAACWTDGGAPGGILNNTMWYTFNGDGNTYHIETTKCNAVNYIGSALPDINGFNPDGDTQMAIFSGQCGNAVLVECNDDQSPEGVPDFRAGLDLQTVPGETYFMMIDGYDYLNNQVATGQYCIEITQLPSIVCADGKVGGYTLDNNGFICTGTNLADYITVVDTAFKIPTIGPIYGLCWAVTSAPVPAGTWPPSMGTSYISSTGFINAPFAIGIANNVTAASVVYVTPVVVSGATEVTPATPLRMENVSVDNPDACFFVGNSSQVILLPGLNPLTGTATSTPPNNGTANNGTINLTPGGGLGQAVGDPTTFYQFVWSNGAITEDLSGLTAGTYTVTISDVSNCVDPVQVQITVIGTAVKDPESVKTLFISPNPTQGKLTLNLELNATAEVRVELINSVGQTLQTIHAGQLNNLNQEIDLHNLANGTYIVRVIMDSETAVRKVILQK